ncbi:MAG: efflux RND transporter periplasmic adaptor subunit [Fimbriimonadales bacterium]
MRRAPWIVVGIIVLLCAVGGYAFRSMQAAQLALIKKDKGATVEKGEIVVKVVDSGTLDAVKVVELRSRASGRLSKLLKDEGDYVKQGELIAIIDPQETELRVQQDSAQLRGAQSSVSRQGVEIAQRAVTAKASLAQAQARLSQLELELKAQPTLTSSAISQAEAAYSSALKQREQLRGSTLPNARTAAEASQREAQANFDDAQRALDRLVGLVEKGYVAERAMESARLNLDLARVRLESANANLSRVDSQQKLELSKADDAVRTAEADLKRARANGIQDQVKKREYESAVADLEKARAAMRDVDAMRFSKAQSEATVAQLGSVLSDSQRQLRETKIFSPITGVITKKFIQEGELVAALSGFSSGTAIVRIEDRTALMVKLSINEIDVAKLQLGMKAQVDVDAFPDMPLTGIVRKIAPASLNLASQSAGQSVASDNVVKYQVEIWLDKPDPKLRSGMSAKCSLETLRRENVLKLPVEYVGKDEKSSYIMLAPTGKDGKPQRKDVKVGASTGALVEIVSGASAGDKVVKPDYKGPERQGMMQVRTGDE